MIINIVLAILATYGISHMIAIEDGPIDIFAKWRELVGAEKQDTWIRRGFSCPMCISVWVALVLCVLIEIGWMPVIILEWLAIIGAIRVIHIWLYK